MNQLAIAFSPAPSIPALLRDDMAAARDFMAAEKADATRRAYRSDWRIFVSYCEARDTAALPALPATVIAFLSAEARGGAKASRTMARIRSTSSHKRGYDRRLIVAG